MDMLTRQAIVRREVLSAASISDTEKMKLVLDMIPTGISQPANQLRIAVFAMNKLVDLVAASSGYTVEQLRASYVKQAIRALKEEGFIR